MSRITWDVLGEHYYETGVDHAVYYPYDSSEQIYTGGVAWNGITAVNESPSGAESNPVYADNIKYLNLLSAEDYSYTIEALTYPDEFDQSNGNATIVAGVKIGQQERKPFGFCYRTLIGNDTEGTTRGYRLHIVYNSTASPSEKSHATVNESPEAASMSWECKTTPVAVTGYKPTAVVEIDSTDFTTTAAREVLDDFEDILYGTSESAPRLPYPDEIMTLLAVS